ncbi:MAG: InlB B-repeat-containing protein, partial [Firmicutes bacterium]|nr:InlB B-repeat-containing protein [Bacillota bacterium]
MIAKAGKKILASMLALTLVLGNVPAIAFAASAETNPLQDGTLVVSEEGNVTVNEDKGSVLVVATPNVDSSSLIPFYEGTTETVVLTNQSDAQQILSFDYSVQGNLKSLTIGGQAYTGTGTWTGVVESGASVDVVLSGNDTDGLVKIGMGNFAFHDNQGKLVDVVASENGTVTEGPFKVSYEIGVPVEATAAEGYQFVAWVDENNQILSTEADTTLHPVASCTVEAVFAAADEPYFKAAGKLFTDLNEAAAYAGESGTGVVVPLKDATIAAGDYTIPSGVTLLVPFDAAETCYLDKGQTAGTTFTPPTTYCKLTFADGANLTVNGELSVSAKHTSGFNSTKTGGTPTESVGMIDLKEGSNITITNGASAYAWGYIIGSGNMVAESGSKIYEIMQIADFRGGTQTKNLLSTVVLPFSQYYIQNIEAPLTLHGGAEEYAFTTLTATLGVTVTASAGIKFIGTEDAMFALEEGTTVTKSYDPSTDRMMLETNGNLALNSMTLNVLGQNLGTQNFNLPINNNISIDVQSGNVVIKQNTAFQPGAEVSVGENASVSVAQQVDENGDPIPTNMYIYDADDWGGFTFGDKQFVDIAYSPTKAYTRTVEKDIKDVVFDINGRFVVEQNAYVYVTAGGAQVISSKGTGSIEFNNTAGSLTETKQADGNGTIVAIPITPMKLQNQDFSYVETASIATGAGFISKNGTWIPATDVELTYDANGGEFIGDSATEVIPKQKILSGEKTALKAWNGIVTKENAIFKGWNTKADGSGTAYADREAVRLIEDTTLYAQWENPSYTLTFDTDGGSAVDPITAPAGSVITPPENPTKEGYTFKAWGPALPEKMPGKNVTYVALWTPNQYTITFDADGGSAVDSITQGYNTTLKEPIAPTKEGYTFTGWEPAFPEKMPLGGMELKATWELTKNTISFDTDGGSEVADIKGYYGDEVTKPADPTKEGYTFAGWKPAFPETMPAEDLKLTAQWTPNQYTITFDTDGGSTIDPITQNYNSLVAAPTAPVKEGYTFIGWDQDVPGKMPAKDVTLKAQWKVNQYTITFDTDGGSEVADMTVDFGAKVEAPAAPVKEGYTFKGWDADIPETMPAEDLQLKAKWEINQYT